MGLMLGAGMWQGSGFLGGGTSPDNPTLEIAGVEKKLEGHKAHPFLLSVHFRAPHAKWLPVAEEDWAPFAEMAEKKSAVLPNPDYPGLDVARVRKMMPEYLADVRGVDRNVGRILAKLEELEIAENTVVIFTSDHGYNMGHNGIWHIGKGHWVVKAPPAATKNVPKWRRPNLYDNSVKVPALVCWPGVVEAGLVIEVPVTKFKLVRDFLNSERDEFFDLVDDPGELTNQIGNPEFKEVVKDLDEKLKGRMGEISDVGVAMADGPAPGR